MEDKINVLSAQVAELQEEVRFLRRNYEAMKNRVIQLEFVMQSEGIQTW